MSGIFLNAPTSNDINYDGFFDGINKTIPENTELTMAITGGFSGVEEGKSNQVCILNFVITTQGEFFGQKYKYTAKIYDMDASKRDRAMQNLSVLDAQAGFPMTNDRLELTTENIIEYWVGSSEARVKMGLFFTEAENETDGVSRAVNYVRGFGYLRDKMIPSGQAKPAQQQQPAQQQPVQRQPTQAEAQAAQQAQQNQEEDDLGW